MGVEPGTKTEFIGAREFTFRLPVGSLFELEKCVNRGAYELLTILRTNTPWLKDVRETIRLGLIGGGMSPLEAKEIVEEYLDRGGDWIGYRPLAFNLLFHAMNSPFETVDEDDDGDDGEGPKKDVTGNPRPQSKSEPSTKPPEP